MVPLHLTLVVFSLLFLLGLASPLPGYKEGDFESPGDDLPRWSSDWSPQDLPTAFDRQPQRMTYYPNTPLPTYHSARSKRDLSSPPSCASAWAKQSADADSAAAQADGSAGSAVRQADITNQYVHPDTQTFGPEDDYFSGPQSYPLGGTFLQQHPNMAQFQRFQTTRNSPSIPGSGNTFYGRSSEPSQTYDQLANQQLGQFSRSSNPSIYPAGQSQPGTLTPQRSSAYYIHPSNQYQEYRSSSSSSSSGTNTHPVQTLPEVFETSSAPKSANQYGFSLAMDPNMYTKNIITSYRSAQNPQANPQQTVEDINTTKTTNPQYSNYLTDYYRQIQQALADGKQLVAGIPNAALYQQLVAGIPNAALNQQFALGTAAQPQPVYTTPAFPVTSLSFDPEEMRRVYGQYYVPPVFNMVQGQPNSPNGATDAVVRDVLQYLLNQYQYSGINNGITSGNRNPRILSDIAIQRQRILHGFDPIAKLPRQSIPHLPSFTGDNQLLPPNVYKRDRWEPKTNIVVHDPVNLAEFEQSGMNQMGQYVARSTPCYRQKRQPDNTWGYYPELAAEGARMAEPMQMFPGLKIAQSPAMYGEYGLEGSHLGRTAIPGLPGFGDPLRQSYGGQPISGYGQPLGGLGQPLGGLGQPTGGYGQPLGGLGQTLSSLGQSLGGLGQPLDGRGQPMGGLGQLIGGLGQPLRGLGQAFGNQAYPDYYQGRDAVSGLSQVMTGIAQMMPIAGNGLPQFRK